MRRDKDKCLRCLTNTYETCEHRGNCRYFWWVNQMRFAKIRRKRGWDEAKILLVQRQRQREWDATHPNPVEPEFEDA